MDDGRCFCLCVVDYQNCSCPDRLISREYANNCTPPTKSLSIIHRKKEKESCADGSCNRENDARFQVLTEDEFSKLQEGYKPVITCSARSGDLTTLKCGGELTRKLRKEDILMSLDSLYIHIHVTIANSFVLTVNCYDNSYPY